MKKRRTAVPVATIWSAPESIRSIDQAAFREHPDMTEWLDQMSRDETIALCREKRIQTQVLFGEEIIIDSVKGTWAKVCLPSQATFKDPRGYPGWMPLNQSVSSEITENKKKIMVQSKYASFYTLTQRKRFDLSFSVCLPLIEDAQSFVKVDSPIGPGLLKKQDVLMPDQQHRQSGEEIVNNAVRFLELPYLWAGMSAYGFDCSGFSYTLLRAGGYLIPRDADDQALCGRAIPIEAALPGDLLFFAYENGKGAVHHVGIYYGNGRMIHSPTPGTIVSITELKGTKYERELCAVRRYWTG